MLLDETINFCFYLVKIFERHIDRRWKTSCSSLVLRFDLVKLPYTRLKGIPNMIGGRIFKNDKN
jgi:hypothetical protein